MYLPLNACLGMHIITRKCKPKDTKITALKQGENLYHEKNYTSVS